LLVGRPPVLPPGAIVSGTEFYADCLAVAPHERAMVKTTVACDAEPECPRDDPAFSDFQFCAGRRDFPHYAGGRGDLPRRYDFCSHVSAKSWLVLSRFDGGFAHWMMLSCSTDSY
jgi:hypothetical protein